MKRRQERAWFAAILVIWPMICGPIEAADKPLHEPPPGRLLERGYSTGLPLIKDGRPVVTIICPADLAEWKPLAEQLVTAIASLGTGGVPVVTDSDAVPARLGPLREDLRDRPLILLGDLNTNRAFFPYYASYYTCCDARYPGKTGYELRTVVRPFGWSASTLLVGGSTREGCAAAVARLAQRIGSLKRDQNVSLPYLLEVELGDEVGRLFAPAMDDLDSERLSEPRCENAIEVFTRNAHLYFYTGDERFARRSRQAAIVAANCDYEQPGFPTNDYAMENLAAAWRRVSCSPAFSPADCAKIDARMYEIVAMHARSWWRISPELGIGNRHQTTGGLAWWTLIRVLRELGVPDRPAGAQLDKWYGEASAYCDGLLRHYWDDEDDYQSADSAQNAASYAMQAGRLDWFESGLARRAAERLMMTVDNLGWSAGIQGYGDALPGWERFPLDAGMLMGACAFVYQDGGYNWVLERFPMLEDSWGSLQPWGLRQFDVGGRIKPTEPDWMTGLRVARFTPYKIDRINSGEFLTTSIMDNFRPAGLFARPVAAELAFDKLMYRGGTSEADPYLLLEGSAGTTLTTIDMNTIIRHGDAGKLWLVHNTGQRSLYFKNGVYMSNGTNQQPMAPSCELLSHLDHPRGALAVSRLPDCRGMAWTRNLLVAKGRFTAVIDHLRAVQAGEYSLSCAWRTPGFAAIEGDRWVARQDDAMFCLLPGLLDGVDSDRPMRGDGATRPTTLRENRSIKASPGDEVVFENVLYTSSGGLKRAYAARRVSPGVILVRSDTDGAFCMVAAGDRGIRARELESDAAAVLVMPSEVFLAGGKSFSVGGLIFKTESGVVELGSAEAERLKSVLARMWDAGTEPAASRPGRSGSPTAAAHGLRPIWQHKGPASRGSRIEGVQFVKGRQVTGLSLLATDWMMPLLRAEPRLMGRQSSELVPTSRAQQAEHAPPAEPILKPLTGAEFTLELPERTKVAEIDFFGETFGQTADPLPPGVMTLELTFSNDGFKMDRRTRVLDLPRRPTYHNLYKGHCYLFECYRADQLNEEASAIRVRVVKGPSNEGIVTDVQVRSAGTPRREQVEMRLCDLDGDGRDEVLAWTGEGDFIVLRHDGTEAWRKRFEQGLLAVDAWDLDEDGVREIFVSRLDRQIDVFGRDGSSRWSKDFRDAKKESGFKYFGDGSAVYGMAVWRPKTERAPRVLCTSYWFSTWLDTKGRWIEAFRRGGHFTQIRQIPADLPGAGGLAIRCDVPWPGSVPVQWWDVETGAPAGENQVPNGKAVYFELADYDGDGQVEALSAGTQGIGLYSLREPKTRWEHMTDAPPIGVGVVTSDAGKPATIFYGRQDGYVFKLSADGKVLASTMIGEPLQSLTVTGAGRPCVWVATRTSLLGLSADLSVAWRESGSYQTLATQRMDGAERVLAVSPGGQVSAFQVSGVE